MSIWQGYLRREGSAQRNRATQDSLIATRSLRPVCPSGWSSILYAPSPPLRPLSCAPFVVLRADEKSSCSASGAPIADLDRSTAERQAEAVSEGVSVHDMQACAQCLKALSKEL